MSAFTACSVAFIRSAALVLVPRYPARGDNSHFRRAPKVGLPAGQSASAGKTDQAIAS